MADADLSEARKIVRQQYADIFEALRAADAGIVALLPADRRPTLNGEVFDPPITDGTTASLKGLRQRSERITHLVRILSFSKRVIAK